MKTKRDFERLAHILGLGKLYGIDHVIFLIKEWCAEENKAFDAERFSSAIDQAEREAKLLRR